MVNRRSECRVKIGLRRLILVIPDLKEDRLIGGWANKDGLESTLG